MSLKNLVALLMTLGATTPTAQPAFAACDDAATTTFIEAGGIRLHYSAAGPNNTAPAVIAIHGASANLCDMKLALLPEAAEARRILFFDRPGLGLSERPEKDGHDPFVQARLLHEGATQLGAEKPVVLAHSLGGAIALAYALAYPDEISGLVLLAPVSHPWPGGVDWHNYVATAPIIGPVFRRTLVPAIGPRTARTATAELLPNYYENAAIRRLFEPLVFKANAEDLVRLKPHIQKMHRRYAEITAPVRILTGGADETVSPVIHSMALHNDIENTHLQIFEGVDHFIQHRRSDDVLAAIDAIAVAAAP